MAIERITDPNQLRSLETAETTNRPRRISLGPLTIVLIAICIVVAIFTQLGAKDAVVDPLFISAERPTAEGGVLPEITQGQVWRLLTPIFLHFGIMHLVFNMLWLKDLGTAIERLCSTRLLFALVLVSGVLSNVGQFIFKGPFFGGMSGVVYALLGFVWMKSKFDPASGFYLDKQTVIMMIGWFFLCAAGIIPNVANYAHGFGLVIGMLWGFTSAKSGGSRPVFARY